MDIQTVKLSFDDTVSLFNKLCNRFKEYERYDIYQILRVMHDIRVIDIEEYEFCDNCHELYDSGNFNKYVFPETKDLKEYLNKEFNDKHILNKLTGCHCSDDCLIKHAADLKNDIKDYDNKVDTHETEENKYVIKYKTIKPACHCHGPLLCLFEKKAICHDCDTEYSIEIDENDNDRFKFIEILGE